MNCVLVITRLQRSVHVHPLRPKYGPLPLVVGFRAIGIEQEEPTHWQVWRKTQLRPDHKRTTHSLAIGRIQIYPIGTHALLVLVIVI